MRVFFRGLWVDFWALDVRLMAWLLSSFLPRLPILLSFSPISPLGDVFVFCPERFWFFGCLGCFGVWSFLLIRHPRVI
ncbi:hypothetical protein [Moraxella lacunata]|uniref:hypothetical protein n=1 Tax=Moraxella lacunata TaxID=477 RepID=UPI003EE37341